MALRDTEREPVEDPAARLAGNTPKSLVLAARFRDFCNANRDWLAEPELVRLARILEKVSKQSVDYAAACLEGIEAAAASLDAPSCRAFFDLAAIVADSSWIELKPYLQRGPDLLASIDPFERAHFLGFVRDATSSPGSRPNREFVEASLALKDVPRAYQGRTIELAEQVLPLSAIGALAFLKNSPYLSSRLSIDEL